MWHVSAIFSHVFAPQRQFPSFFKASFGATSALSVLFGPNHLDSLSCFIVSIKPCNRKLLFVPVPGLWMSAIGVLGLALNLRAMEH